MGLQSDGFSTLVWQFFDLGLENFDFVLVIYNFGLAL